MNRLRKHQLCLDVQISVLAIEADGDVNSVEESLEGESEEDKEPTEETISGNDSEENVDDTADEFLDDIDNGNGESDITTDGEDSGGSVEGEEKIEEEEKDIGKLEDSEESSVLENTADTETFLENDVDVQGEDDEPAPLAEGVVDSGQCGDCNEGSRIDAASFIIPKSIKTPYSISESFSQSSYNCSNSAVTSSFCFTSS